MAFRTRALRIAIRMALGAQRTGIARLVLVSGAKTSVLRCCGGVLASLACPACQFIPVRSHATDPLLYIAGVSIMMLMALLASALPRPVPLGRPSSHSASIRIHGAARIALVKPLAFLLTLTFLLEAQYRHLECLLKNRKNISSCCKARWTAGSAHAAAGAGARSCYRQGD